MKTKVTNLRPADKQTMTLEQINERVASLTTKRGGYQKTLAHINNIKSDTTGPLWQHIKLKCNDLITGAENLEDQADEYDPKNQSHPIPDRTIWKALGIKKAAKTILGIQNLVDNEEGYRTTLDKIEKELKDLGARKQQLSAGK